MRSRKPALSEAEGDPLYECAATAYARSFYHCRALISQNAGPLPSYGTLSLASSDRALSFPRKSTADTE
jgi:hypothetical protein